MILAAGLTPAWQQIMRFESFRPGEVNRAVEVHRCASGKVLNVGIALAHLGVPCTTLAPLGGPALAAIEAEFSALGAGRRWIDVAAPTRVCTTILDEGIGQVTELVENAEPLGAGELQRFSQAFAELAAAAKAAVITGSLPRAVPRTFFRELAQSARCPLILDIRGQELIEALACRPLVVKPNRDELAYTLSRDLGDDGALRGAMAELNERGAEWVVVTHGEQPVWASSRGQFYRFPPCTVEVVNPIGSGDCLAAGMAWGLLEGAEPLEALVLGIAAAAENARQLLPGRIDPRQVRMRRPSVIVDRL